MLKSGEEIAATIVASSADPRRTLLGLLETGWLDPDFTLAVENIKFRGVAATVTLTLDKAAEFRTLVEAPSLNYLERAYDDAKYGRVSAKPWFEARAEGNRLDHPRAVRAVRTGRWRLDRGAPQRLRRCGGEPRVRVRARD